MSVLQNAQEQIIAAIERFYLLQELGLHIEADLERHAISRLLNGSYELYKANREAVDAVDYLKQTVSQANTRANDIAQLIAAHEQ